MESNPILKKILKEQPKLPGLAYTTKPIVGVLTPSIKSVPKVKFFKAGKIWGVVVGLTV